MQNGNNSLKAVVYREYIGAVILNIWLAHYIYYRAYLEQYLLKPKFICLVDHNEQHLIMRMGACLIAFKLLGVQYFIKLQILAVVNSVFHHFRFWKVKMKTLA